jgi:hypothetical protein
MFADQAGFQPLASLFVLCTAQRLTVMGVSTDVDHKQQVSAVMVFIMAALLCAAPSTALPAADNQSCC